MSGVKKWDHVVSWSDSLQITSTMMGLSETGKYVLASDYDQLRTANQRLEGEVARLREIIARSAEACGGYIDNACSLEFMELLPAEIKAKIAALSTANGEVT